MATEKLSPYDVISVEAGADLSAKQYFLTVFSAGKLALAGAGATVLGVLTDKPTTGQYGTVAVKGLTKVVAGAAITQGVRIASDANGKAVAAGANTESFGIALQEAGADGEVIECLIDRQDVNA